MSIAAIIVNYQTGALVLDHLERIRAELATVPGSHLYIVDNASPAGCAALLERATADMDDVSVIAAPKNGGFSYGNNRGLERAFDDAAYEYVYLLNPDAYPLPGCLATLKRFLDEHPAAGIAGSRLEGEDGSVQRSAFRYMSIASEFEQAAALGPISKLLAGKLVAPPAPTDAAPMDWVCGASMLMTRAVVDAIGLMDEAYFLYYEEVDYQRAAKMAGFEVWYVPEARAVHLVGQSTDMKDGKQSVGTSPPYWFDSRRYYFRKNHGAFYAIAADGAWVAGKALNAIKSVAKGNGLSGIKADIAGLRAASRRAKQVASP